MKKLLFWASSLFATVIMALMPLFPAHADGAATDFSPTTGAIFANPVGTTAEQNAIIDDINNAIDATPKGATISIATYVLNLDSTAGKLSDAADRGVNVHLLLDSGHDSASQQKMLEKKLGSDTKKSSYAVACTKSCLTHATGSIMHAKMYLFSQAGSASNVSIIGSANISNSVVATAWNNIYTTANDATMYNANLKYFADMAKQKNNPDYYSTTVDGGMKSYYFPRAGDTPDADTYLSVLDNVKCTGANSAYGDGAGHTVIHVAMFYWSYGRRDIAEKLWDLDNSGCVVDVVYFAKTVDPRITAILLKKDAHGGIQVYDSGVRVKGTSLHTHDKFISISGNYVTSTGSDTTSKLIFTGSANFTDGAQRENCENMLKLSDATSYQAYVAHFHFVRDNYTTQVTKVPPTPKLADGSDNYLSDTPNYDLLEDD